MKYPSALLIALIPWLISCQSGTTQKNTDKASSPGTQLQKGSGNGSAAEIHDSTGPAVPVSSVAVIDDGQLTIKLHQLVQFRPKGGEYVYKVDTEKNDYYVMDISLTNHSARTVNSGKDYAFWISIESNTGRNFWDMDNSVEAQALYKREVSPVIEGDYKKYWGILNPGESVRTIPKGFVVPKGTIPAKFILIRPDKAKMEAVIQH